ncbi:MAG: SIS domain-containing protein [Chloroflexi bacterium]|nr:SIS domain-containing protein [Chloroflexota bacterium]
MQNATYISEYLDGMRQITETISREAIDDVIEALFDVYRRGGTIWICGNGGSASTATHFACDLTKATIRPGKPRVKAMALADNIPLVSALTNDDGWDLVYLEQLKSFFRDGDAVIGISVHGGAGQDKAGAWSQNLLRALEYAKEHGGTAIGLAGFDGGGMKTLCDHCIVVPYDTTPHVESYHVALHHLIAFCLAEKIARLETT